MFIVIGSTTGKDYDIEKRNFGYKPLTNEWVDLGQLAVPRQHGDAVVYNGKLKSCGTQPILI